MPYAPLQRQRSNSVSTARGSGSFSSGLPAKVGSTVTYSKEQLKKLAEIDAQLKTNIKESNDRLAATLTLLDKDKNKRQEKNTRRLDKRKKDLEEEEKNENTRIERDKLNQFQAITTAALAKNKAITLAKQEELQAVRDSTTDLFDQLTQQEKARAKENTAIEIAWLKEAAEVSRKVIKEELDEQGAKKAQSEFESIYKKKKDDNDKVVMGEKSRIETATTASIEALPDATKIKTDKAEQDNIDANAAHAQQATQQEAKSSRNEKKRGFFSLFTSSSSATAANVGGGAAIRDLKAQEWQAATASATSTHMGTVGGGIGLTAAGLGYVDDALTIGKNFGDRNHEDEARRRDARGDLKSAALNIGIRSIDVSAQGVGLAVTIGAATAASVVAAPVVAAVAGTVGTVRSGVRGVKAQQYKSAIEGIDQTGLSDEMKSVLGYAGGQMKVRRNKMGVEVLAGTVGVAGAVALSVAAIAGAAALMATPVGWGLAAGAAAIGLGYLLYRVGRNLYKRYKGEVGSQREQNAGKIVNAYLGIGSITLEDKRAATDLLKALKILPTTPPATKEQVINLTNLVAKKLKSS